MTRFFALLGLGGLSTAGVMLALTLKPLAHDFGGATPSSQSMPRQFTVTLPGGGAPRDKITVAVTGVNAADFGADAGDCDSQFWKDSCTVNAVFRPRSLGLKSAQLVVRTNHGATVQATLKGEGVNPTCTNRVVFCNYAFLYSGNFDWTTATETVKVLINDGVATCNGSVVYRGRPKGIVSGTGLVAVEFLRGSITDSLGKEGPERLVYRVTVACPSPAIPATADGPATPSRPAELGDFFRETYNQPADFVGMNLTGTSSFPVEDDGVAVVTWTLNRKP